MDAAWSYDRISELFEHGFRLSGTPETERHQCSIHIKQILACGRVDKDEASAIIEFCPAIFGAIALVQHESIGKIFHRFPMSTIEFCELLDCAKHKIVNDASLLPITHSEYIGSND